MPVAPPRPCSRPGCPELAPCPVHGARPGQSYRERREREPWRKLYSTARWLTLRRIVLDAQPTCPQCRAEGRPPTPTVDVHHERPHRGDVRTFFDRSNLRALCHPCHARITGREVRR